MCGVIKLVLGNKLEIIKDGLRRLILLIFSIGDIFINLNLINIIK